MNRLSLSHKSPETKGISMENASPLLQVVNTYVGWLIALVVVLVLAVGYQFLLSPKIQAIVDKNQTYLPTKESTLQDLKTVEQKLIQLRQEYGAIQTNRRGELDKLIAVIPNEPDYPSLFVQAEYLANKRGIELESIDISQPADPALSERRTPTPTQAGSTAEQQLEILPRNVSSLTIAIKLGPASYESLQVYLDDLERNLRLFDIQTLAFDEIDPESLKSKGIDITVKTYYRSTTSKTSTNTNNQDPATTIQ
jgi:Tfp pilus assembly protein PilO